MTLLARNPRTAFRSYDSQTLVITADDSKVHVLNETSGAIWELLEKGALTIDSIADSLEQAFDCAREEIMQGVTSFAATGLKAGFLISEDRGNA